MRKKIQEALEEINKVIKSNKNITEYALAGVLCDLKILLMSSHGKAKSLLAKTISKVTGLTTSRVQGSQGLTESKYLARYNISELMKGKEKVIWKDFVDADIKFIDEINRVHPTALNAIFPMLAENEVDFGGEVKQVKPFSLFATMNPADEGTFTIPAPLIDRFDINLLLQSTTIFEKINIIDVDIIEPKVLFNKQEIENIKQEIAQIKIPGSIILKLSYIIRDLQLCKYGDKEFLNNFPQSCIDCNFKNNVCAMIDNSTPLSDRAFLSSIKMLKSLSYIRNCNINDHLIFEVLKIVLPHRIKASTNCSSNYNTNFEFIQNLLNNINSKEDLRAKPMNISAKIFSKKASLDELEPYIKNDLLIKEIYNNLKHRNGIKTRTLSEKINNMDLKELIEYEEKINKGIIKPKDTVMILQKIEKLKEQKLQYSEQFKDRGDFDSFIAKLNNLSNENENLSTKIYTRLEYSPVITLKYTGGVINCDTEKLEVKIKFNTPNDRNIFNASI